MKIALLYITGTYNTLKTCEMLKDVFTMDGDCVDLYDLQGMATLNDFSEYDLIGLAYPIYAFNAPKRFEQIIKMLPIENKPYFIMKNSGEPLKVNNASSVKTIKIMTKKHCTLQGEYHLLMPYNIMFRFPNALVKQMIGYNKRYLKYIVNELKNNRIHLIKYNFYYILNRNFFRLQRFGAKFNSRLYRVDKKKCNKCMLCIKNCPRHNITIKKEYPHFGSKCDMCMRCSMYCHQDAIKIGFLNTWRVNKEYDFASIMADEKIPTKYITEESKRFYKKYIKYYQYLDEILPSENNKEE